MSTDAGPLLHSASLIMHSSELTAQLWAGFVFVAVHIGSAIFFTLPVFYNTRAAAYEGGPAQQITFLSLLVIEWKAFIAGALFCLSIDLTILQSQYVVESTILRTTGYIAVAFSVVSFASSSALVVVASARRMGIEAQHRGNRVVESNAVAIAAPAATDIEMGSHSALNSDDPQPAVQLGPPTLIAVPAICMSWCAIFSVLCMLLFVWYANQSIAKGALLL